MPRTYSRRAANIRVINMFRCTFECSVLPWEILELQNGHFLRFQSRSTWELTCFSFSYRTIRVLDQYLENVPLEPGQNLSQNEAQIAVFTQEYDIRDFAGAAAASVEKNTADKLVVYDDDKGVQEDISQVSLAMPSSLFEDLDIDVNTQSQRISFIIYRKTSFFTTSENKEANSQTNTVRKTNSFVISGSVKGQRLTNLADPITTTYQPLDAGIDETTACVFWNFTAGSSTSGNWSSVGCSYQGTEDGVVTCHCTHLTNFAILMVSFRQMYYLENDPECFIKSKFM